MSSTDHTAVARNTGASPERIHMRVAHEDLLAYVDAFAKTVVDRPPLHALARNIEKNVGEVTSGIENVASTMGERASWETKGACLSQVQTGTRHMGVNLVEVAKQVRGLIKESVPAVGKIAKAWDNVLDATQHYTTVGMNRLAGVVKCLQSEKDRYDVGFVSGNLQETQDTALALRKAGIQTSLASPHLGEYALADARKLSMIAESKSVHRGTIVNVIGQEAVLKNAKGQLMALPVAPDFKFRRGDNVVMKEHGGTYSGKRQIVDREMER
ncbi:hypothetical protein [Acidithiobacillus ferridurans]|uniref:Uncharacterized protein n=3 Tax=root TaxID=1 RepID=A0A2Z6IE58_ACIFI|nr:hypothetical protein [Acidithiobacillus ferridurans]MBU2724067.1 hypothetical protein [Acidithiobacillus ferridurans]MBU2727455.1 hypothetical protein [Acidithiobacillus ferridurans]BBF63822.1 hypothetical protein AFERRID_00400 [Acidithiobacillus ferridurans]